LRRTKIGHPVELRSRREGSGAALSHIASDAGLADGPLPLLLGYHHCHAGRSGVCSRAV